MRLTKSARNPKKPPTDEVELEVARVVDKDKLVDAEGRLDRSIGEDVVDETWRLGGEDEKLDSIRGKEVVVGTAELLIAFGGAIIVVALTKGCSAISGDFVTVIFGNTEEVSGLTAASVLGISLLVKSSCTMITC